MSHSDEQLEFSLLQPLAASVESEEERQQNEEEAQLEVEKEKERGQLSLSSGAFSSLVKKAQVSAFAQAMVETFMEKNISSSAKGSQDVQVAPAENVDHQECFAVIVVALLSALQQGHPCLPLLQLASSTLELEEVSVGPFPDLISLRKIVSEQRQVKHLSVVQECQERSTAPEPFVLVEDYLYLTRFHSAEGRLADFFSTRMYSKVHEQQPAGMLSEAQQKALDRYFPDAPKTDRQKQAAESALNNQTMIISGGPGTGKTTTVARILGLLTEQFYDQQGQMPRLLLMAPTGKAAARLNESLRKAVQSLPASLEVKNAIEQTANTLHSALGLRHGKSRYDEQHPLAVDLVLVDEASMVDLALMSSLTAVIPKQARLILIGDRHQLASVDAGSVFFDLCVSLNKGPVVELVKSYRFKDSSGIGRLAAMINRSDSKSLSSFLHLEGRDESGDTHFYDISKLKDVRGQLRTQVLEGIIPALDAASPGESLQKFQEFRLLAAHRKGKWGVESLNQWIKDLLIENGRVRRGAEFYQGQLIMVSKNDSLTGLRNGDIGVIWEDDARSVTKGLGQHSPRGSFRAYFESGEAAAPRSFALAQLPHFETAFASTVHKSQGSEFTHVIYVGGEHDSPLLTKELLYTAVTRAKKKLSIFATESTLLQSVGRCVARDSRLASRIIQAGELPA